MPGDRPLSISSSSHLTPDEVARRTFATVRRGYSTEEVRGYLESISRSLLDSIARENELHERLTDAEHRAANPVLDEETLTAALGQETSRVLHTAREASSEMVAKATAEADRLLAEARDELTQGRARIEAEDTERRRLALDESTNALNAARAEGEALVAQARDECRQMVEEAQALRAKVLADLSRRRKVLHAQIDQLRAGRERLAETVRDVRQSIDAIADDLFRAEDEARLAAEVAGRQALARASDGDVTDDVGDAALLSEPGGEDGGSDQVAAGGWSSTFPTTADAIPSVDDVTAELPHIVDVPSVAFGGNEVTDPTGSVAAGGLAPDDEVSWAIVDIAVPRDVTDPGGWAISTSGGEAAVPAGGFDDVTSTVPVPDTGGGSVVTVVGAVRAADAGTEQVDLHAEQDRPADTGGVDLGAASVEVTSEPDAPAPDVDEPVVSGAVEGEAASELEVEVASEAAGDETVAVIAEPEVEPALPPEPDVEPDTEPDVQPEVQPDTEEEVAGHEPEAPADDVATSGEPGPTEAVREGAVPSTKVEALFAKIRASREDTEVEPQPEVEPEVETDVDGVADAESVADVEPATDAEPPADAAGAEAGPGAEVGAEVDAGPTAGAHVTSNGVPAPDLGFQGPPLAQHPLVASRDQVVAPIVVALSRRMKRTLQDDQNELLDRLRSSGSQWSVDLLPEEPEHHDAYATAALPFLLEAAQAGRALVGAEGGGAPSTDDLVGMAHDLAEAMVGTLRRRLADDERVHDADESVVAEHVGAAFREWKGARVEGLAGDSVIAAFSAGSLGGAGDLGTQLEWVAVPGASGEPCPDCDDNVLHGPQQPGGEFPTGHVHPPVHPGCRCLLVPSAT